MLLQTLIPFVDAPHALTFSLIALADEAGFHGGMQRQGPWQGDHAQGGVRVRQLAALHFVPGKHGSTYY